MKICTVVLTYDTPLYNQFDYFKRKYLENRNTDYYFVYNGTDISKHNLANRTINYFSEEKHPAGIPMMFRKFIEIIKSGLLDEYDFVIRSNSSTFINIDVIKEILQTKTTKLYMGKCEIDDPSPNFVSGTCTIFSADTLKLLAENSDTVNHYREDDVVIGQIMKNLGIPATYLPWYEFFNYTVDSIPDTDLITEALKQSHIRIMNPLNREIIDIAIWKTIMNILKL